MNRFDTSTLTVEAIGLLFKLIAIPSHSREETAAADCLQAYIEAQGLTVQRKGNNLWCIAPDYHPERPTLLLNSHIDTVRPVSGWTYDPYQPELDADARLHGLGSNDAGGSVVSLLHTFLALSRRPQAYNLIFLASCEEEVSGKGGIESVLPELPPITCALVGEPTDMQPAIAEKGLMVLDVTATGRSGHAARNEGDNAIYKALDDIAWFRDYRFPRESPLLGPVKMSVTVIQAGTQHNVVPDRCTFTVDIRSNECYTNQQLFEEIQQHIHGQATARSFRLSSSSISTKHPLVKRAISLGRTPFGSPTLSDQALMTFPSLKMGPGSSSRSHTANEYIYLSEIEDAIDLYLRLLNGAKIGG